MLARYLSYLCKTRLVSRGERSMLIKPVVLNPFTLNPISAILQYCLTVSRKKIDFEFTTPAKCEVHELA